jgi:hypothetical protein
MLQWWDRSKHRYIRQILFQSVTQISHWIRTHKGQYTVKKRPFHMTRTVSRRPLTTEEVFNPWSRFSSQQFDFLLSVSFHQFSTLIHSCTHHGRYMVGLYSLKLTSDSVLEQHTINQSLTMWIFPTTTTVSLFNYLRMLFELNAASNEMEQSRRNVSRQSFGTNIFWPI